MRPRLWWWVLGWIGFLLMVTGYQTWLIWPIAAIMVGHYAFAPYMRSLRRDARNYKRMLDREEPLD